MHGAATPRAGDALLQPRNHRLEPGVGHRFHDVVVRAALECFHRVFIESRDKYDVAASGNRCGHFQARLARHADIEECDIGPFAVKSFGEEFAIFLKELCVSRTVSTAMRLLRRRRKNGEIQDFDKTMRPAT